MRARATSILLRLLFGVGALLCFQAHSRPAHACACCDGESVITPIGFDARGRFVLTHKRTEGCQNTGFVQYHPRGHRNAAACRDLFRPKLRERACSEIEALPSGDGRGWATPPSWSEPQITKPVSLAASEVHATVETPAGEGPFQPAHVVVWIRIGDHWVDVFETDVVPYGAEYPEEVDDFVYPLEVTIIPADAGSALLLLRGFNSANGIGHRDFMLRWLVLPEGTPVRKGDGSSGVQWVSAIEHVHSQAAIFRNASWLYVKGFRLLRQGDPKQAQRHFEAVLREEHDHLLARYNLACALARQGYFARALLVLQDVFAHPDVVVETRKQQILQDPDLVELRKQPQFRAWFSGLGQPTRDNDHATGQERGSPD
jgi:hypothetical protein